MVKHITRADLRTAVRNRGEFRSAYITDTELNTYINVSLAHLYDIIISVDPTYYLEYDKITIASGTREYDLPDDFYKCVGVAMKATDLPDGYAVLSRYNFEERYDPITADAATDWRYEIRGNSIFLHPTPDSTEELRLEYIPVPTNLAADDDVWDSVNLWTEWVVLDVVIACAAKEETDATAWVQQREKVEARIKGIAIRDLSEVKTSSTASTLKDLRNAVRNRGKWARTDISDGQLTQWVNSSMSGLLDVVCRGDPSYFISYEDISVVAGAREYDLPSDFYKVIGVDAYDASLTDGYYQLDHFNWDERWDETTTSAKSSTRYSIRGNYIYFQPTPTWTGTVRLEYISNFPTMDEPTDTFDFPNDYSEWVILDCAIKAAAFMGTDPQVYLAQQQKVEQRIATFGQRDLVEPAKPSTTGTLKHLQYSIRTRGNWDKKEFSDSQLTEYVNSSISAFWDMLIQHEPSYLLSQSDVSVVSGTRAYSLPSNFYKVMGVSVVDASVPDGYSALDRFMWDERYDYSYITDKWDARYEIRGSYIYFHPTPTWTETVRIEYIPLPTALSEPSDTFSAYNNWQEFVILDVCIKCATLKDQGNLVQIFMAQKAEVQARIIGMAERDIGRPKHVVDVKRPGRYEFYWRR